MSAEEFIEIGQLCLHYEIESSFIVELNDYGLIEINTVDQIHCIHQDCIGDLEKILRLHRDLSINLEGVVSVLHLLDKIEQLQVKLIAVQSRLQLYEDSNR